MDPGVEPMEVEDEDVFLDTEVYKFDDLIDDSIKLNDTSERRPCDFEKSPEIREKTHEIKNGGFYTGIDIFSKEEQQKMEERAKRFGLVGQVKKSNINEYNDLFSSLGIDEDCEAIKNLRLNALHMRGTDDMSTSDVLKYFEQYAPASVEWINDVSCNVLWLDNLSAARALKGMSKKIVGRDGTKNTKLVTEDSEKSPTDGDVEIGEEEGEIVEKDENTVNFEDITEPLPPVGWRKGIDCEKSNCILLRFANRTDKKPRHAEKLSEYYKKHGNPNFGGMKGLLSQSRKRFYKQMKCEGQGDGDLNSSSRKKNPWGSLSQNWGVNDSVESDFRTSLTRIPQAFPSRLKDRLGEKCPVVSREKTPREPTPSSLSSDSESESDSENEWRKRSKVLRMRMHADDEEKKIQKRKSKVGKICNDLRSRLSRKTEEKPIVRDSIQIVVMNPQYSNNNAVEVKSEEEEEDGEVSKKYLSDEDEEQDEVVRQEDDVEEDGEVEEYEEDEDEENDSDSSEIPEREVQGPKGSVIKVVSRKPRLASTVWTRLNNMKSVVGHSTLKERYGTRRDLRDTISKGVSGDLRSRLGNYVRGCAPLRIEVKNDKCTKDDSATD